MRHPLVFAIALLLAVGSSPPLFADDDEAKIGPPVEFKKLRFRSIGPAVGGRVSRACGVAGDPLTYYAATASGGVWKSSDGGFGWQPIFDDQPIASIGSIAVAPSDPNVIYVGSGEANIRGNVAPGNGIYKSTDAGKTWKHVWKQEGQIGTMIVHPTNADVAYAAVLGNAFGPNEERGVYRTTDGGKSWLRVLFKDRDTGASDVCFDPANPRILFAGLWQARRRPWELTSGGPGSGLYTSRDGGETWKHLGGAGVAPENLKGLPEGIYGKIGVAVAPSDSRRIYALIEAEKGGLYRSDDGGESWKLASNHHSLLQRAWYFFTVTIDPKNADVVWAPQVPMLKSIDGGKTFTRVKGIHHGDHHDVWIDSRNPKRMIASNDGGVDISLSGGETWHAPRLPIGQFYHVSVDNRVPYHVAGTMQDLGTASGPSNSLHSGGITLGDWREVGGGEAGHTASDPTDPNIVYAGEYGGYISRYDHRTRQARNISIYPTNPSGHGGEDLRYRFQWTAPIFVSQHDAKVVYHGANVLFRTTDGGKSWTKISPDLTRNDKTKQRWSGGPITGDNTGVEIYCTIFAIAESPVKKGVVWTGSDDGLVQVSPDGGSTWTNVTANIPGMPEWGTVSCIEPSHFEAGTAYVVVDAHRMDDLKPHLFKTADFGKTWKSLSNGLPAGVYLHVVREDPRRQGVLYVGTELGVAYSTDDGQNWQALKLNLPPVAVHDLRVKNNDLVVGTHGRSIWIFDDLTPIRDYSKSLATQAAHLFPPLPAVRWRLGSAFHERGPGQNPASGAVVNYFLKDKPTKPITLEILDAKGKLVAKVLGKTDEKKPTSPPPKQSEQARPAAEPSRAEPTEQAEPEGTDPDEGDDPFKEPTLTTVAGINRFVWNLRYAGAATIKGAKIDAGEPRVGPLANPGSYTAKLTVAGQSHTVPLVIQSDPRVAISASELDRQLEFALRLREDITRLTKTVEQIRSIRNQIRSRNQLLKGIVKAAPLIQLSGSLITKLDKVEAKLHNPNAKVVYDILAQKGGAQLYSKLSPLFEWIKDSDGAPGQGMVELQVELAKELEECINEFSALLNAEITPLNTLARKLEVPTIVLPDFNDAYALGADSHPQPGVPAGKVTQFRWESKIFPNTIRDCWVYVPAQYDPQYPACVMVFQDGGNYANVRGQFRIPIVFDNLIHKKEMPVTIGIFINPGGKAGEQRPGNRSFEYDTLSDQYARFLDQEILPEVGMKYRLRQDAAGRAIGGISSGGICAFTVAWERPDLFSKVLSHVGSFTNIRGGDVYPGRIRKTPPKPIRIFLQDGSGDLNNQHGHWPLANLQMASALEFAKYDFRFEYGDGAHNGKHGGAILPDSLRWLWRDVK